MFVLVSGDPVAASNATADVFSQLIVADNLARVWRFSNANQTWSFFDPRPAFARANTLTEALSGDIVWVYVDIKQAFQGQTLVAGSNLIALD